jgi:hypothetical protein
VRDVAQISATDVGTEGKGWMLPAWCDQHHFRSILFVAAMDTTRDERGECSIAS